MKSDYDWRGLMAAVIVQAIEDARGQDIAKALDAALWLVGNDVPLWLEAVDLPNADALKLVTRRLSNGRAKDIRGLDRKAGQRTKAAHCRNIARVAP